LNYSSGLVLIDKPVGMTSNDAISIVKSRLPGAKVGHTGTLDKFAQGLLIVLAGKLTRLTPLFMKEEKEYRAIFHFGIQTDTLDPDGKVIAEADCPEASTIENTLKKFEGEIMQKPPLYSAVHYKGKRAYKMVRMGNIPELIERKITIFSIENLGYDPPFLHLKIVCSKGTYIRSLARDLGLSCGSRAYVEKLERTRIGAFPVKDSVAPRDFNPEKDLRSSKCAFTALGIPVHLIKGEYYKKIARGIPLNDLFFEYPPERDGLCALFDRKERFAALIEKRGKKYRYHFVGAA